jgi:DNA-binding transcriptional regulator YdaS (Cro superfamily)
MYDELCKTAVRKAVDLAGGPSKLARLLGNGFSQSQISNWLYRNKRVPSNHVILVEKALKGQITRYELRPDLYPTDE